MNLTLKEIISFRRMLTPTLVKFIFWIGLVVFLVVGILDFFQGKFFVGFLLITLGTLTLRILCEILILFFQINNTLLDIMKNTKNSH